MEWLSLKKSSGSLPEHRKIFPGLWEKKGTAHEEFFIINLLVNLCAFVPWWLFSEQGKG